MPLRRLFFALSAVAVAGTAAAAEPEWLKLQAPSFGVVSQLGADATLRWAVEFDQFIGAMETLYDVEDLALPPLTIVLFRQSKGFAPYRIQTESGQAQVAGFFGRTGDWSVIGLSGGSRDTATRRLIYHEAVHWFVSASTTPSPLWFSEGMADVLSTFRRIEDRGRWGEAIDAHVQYLAYTGLLPMEGLLTATQDEALHGKASNRYYPQSWLFVHYAMFGNGGAQSQNLSQFLRLQREMDIAAAFDTAFGKSLDDFESDLRGYLRNGRYAYAEVALRDRGKDMTVEPASAAAVEFALGRLAVAGGNLDLARAHAERVVALAPSSPAGHELLAYATRDSTEGTALQEARDRAIALRSSDSWVYLSKANELVFAEASRAPDDLMSAATARQAADLYARAIGIRPSNPEAIPGFVLALLNLDSITDADTLTLNASRVMFPTQGLLLVGQAGVEKQNGNVREAIEWLGRSYTQPYALPATFRRTVVGLREKWQAEWYGDQFARLAGEGRFDEYRSFLDEQLADAANTERTRRTLESMRDRVPELERFYAATEAMSEGRRAQALEMLTDMIDDPTVSESTKRLARRLLGGRPGPEPANVED